MNRAHIGASLAKRAGFVIDAEESILQEYGVRGAHGYTGPTVEAQITIDHDMNLSFGPLFFFSKHRRPFPMIYILYALTLNSSLRSLRVRNSPPFPS
jgi:hypothetical protein